MALATKPCKVCNTAFVPGRPNQQTCSRDCGYTLRQRNFAKEKAAKPDDKPEEVRSETPNTLDITLNRTDIKTLDDLIREYKIDTDVWIAERFKTNTWPQASKDADSNIQVVRLYQSSAFFRRRSPLIADTKEILAKLKADAEKDLRQLKPVKPSALRKVDQQLMAEVAIADPHFGKLGWQPETGQPSFDLHIATKQYDRASERAVQHIHEQRAGTVLIPIGNDQIHFDTESKTTTSGTPQDADGRLPKVFETSFHATRRLIDAALKTGAKRVVVILIRGNHAEQAEFSLAFALHCWYRDDKRVEVDYAPTYRKTFEWGDCLLGFTHGKESSRKKLPTLFLSEFRDQVSRKYIEIHTGDLHQVRLEEEFGIRVRILPSLAGTDAWHARKGYVMNLPQAETYFWHQRDGLRALFPFTV